MGEGAGILDLGAHMEPEIALTQAVYNNNIDGMNRIFSEAGSVEARAKLANTRDKNKEPLVHITIRKGSQEAFDAFVAAGANLYEFDGPNQALHIAAMYGKHVIAEKIIALKIKPRQNLKSFWPSDMASKYYPDDHDFARLLKNYEQSANPTASLSSLKREGQNAQTRQPFGGRPGVYRKRQKV